MAYADIPCAVAGCNSPLHASRLCSKHYQRKRAYGDPLHPVREKVTPQGNCAEPGCERAAKTKGFCGTHYAKARSRALGIKPKPPAACQQIHDCQHCGRQFKPKAKGRTTFCSRECSFAFKAKQAASKEELAARAAARAQAAKVQQSPRACTSCGVFFTPKDSRQKRCSLTCHPPATAMTCRTCGTSYEKRRWDHGHCSIECRAKERKAKSKESLRVSGAKAAARKARKLKLRGVKVEQVNPLVVLRRDGWRCQLCGVSTPQRLRGTYDDRAPEVDHIVPISKGGEHSYRNTQCACRKCNLDKAGSIKGQMRLFG